MTDDAADRRHAIAEVREDRERTLALLDAIDADALTMTGLGGGEWSPKDLIGHLETWEQHALDAIAAWARGERPPIGDALETLGTDEVNRRAVAGKAAVPLEELRTLAADTHRVLLEAFETATDAWWDAPADEDANRTRGQILGGILGGERGLFRHDPDHWDDLAAFGAAHPARA